MRIGTEKVKHWLNSSVYAGLAVFFVFMGAGCASSQKITQPLS